MRVYLLGDSMITWTCGKEAERRLEPVFHADVVDLLTSSPYDWRVVYGFRSLALQQKLYNIHLAGGPLAAPPGRSAHNFGLAVDVQLWISNGKGGRPRMEWNTKHPGWQDLFNRIRPTPRLHSGVSFGDADHIERYHWREYRRWNKDEHFDA